MYMYIMCSVETMSMWTLLLLTFVGCMWRRSRWNEPVSRLVSTAVGTEYRLKGLLAASASAVFLVLLLLLLLLLLCGLWPLCDVCGSLFVGLHVVDMNPTARSCYRFLLSYQRN